MKKANNHKDFKIPEGYLDGFTDKLMERISTSEGDQEARMLPKSDGFKIPDNYFDGLHSNIIEKLEEEEKKVITLKPWRNNLYYAAASVAAAILLTIALQYNQSSEPTFESLAKADIEEYFDQTDFGFSTYEIAEVIPVDDLEVADILEYQFNEENIIDYLDDDIDNIEELNLLDNE